MSTLIHNGDCAFSLPLQRSAAAASLSRVGRSRARVTRRQRCPGAAGLARAPRGDQPPPSHHLKKLTDQQLAARVRMIHLLLSILLHTKNHWLMLGCKNI